MASRPFASYLIPSIGPSIWDNIHPIQCSWGQDASRYHLVEVADADQEIDTRYTTRPDLQKLAEHFDLASKDKQVRDNLIETLGFGFSDPLCLRQVGEHFPCAPI